MILNSRKNIIMSQLEEISKRCPVHRTLTGEVKIRTKVGDIV